MAIEISSPAFSNGEPIPDHFACDGDSISPPLSWAGIPQGTQSIAIVMEDPSNHGKAHTHWVIFNIPPDITSLSQDIGHERRLSNGAIQGKNDTGKIGYIGPCTPGAHKYFVRLYALDTKLDLNPGATKEQLEEAMKGHIIDQGELMGTYVRIHHARP